MVTYSVYDVKEALDLFDQKNYEDALSLFLKIYETSKLEINESSSLVYYIAICLDALGKHFEAAEWILKAKELDSFNYYTEQAAQYIFQNVELILLEKIKKNDHLQTIEDIYHFLYQSGRISSQTQFHMIRFYMKVKSFNQAKALLDNALERNPHDRELIKMRKELADLEGDLEMIKKLSGK
jgi:tetratricopeptide (TPR) repeat protein